jgi:Helix-hairpin-helix motif
MPSTQNLLDLNRADRKLLTQLPGVAKDLAYKIVNFRQQHGGFADWSEVQTVTGFSKAEMDTLKQHTVVGPRTQPVTHERQVISRWRGKSKHDHEHLHG